MIPEMSVICKNQISNSFIRSPLERVKTCHNLNKLCMCRVGRFMKITDQRNVCYLQKSNI